MKYNPKKTEKTWQEKWSKSRIYRAIDGSKKKKFYGLVEFPYPSGDGLHTGHTRSYTAMDIICRKKRMEGFNVLYPIGWDAFGLPTENYAIKNKVDPHIVTKKNTDTFRKQLQSIGLSFDWNREINTTDPSYYKWTQWMFIKMWENDLVYKKRTLINWCPKCKIGLANEEVVGGKCERCGAETEKKEKDQWIIAITKYANELEKGLEKLDYLEKIKIQQKNWIGRSEGSLFKFAIFQDEGRKEEEVEVFTTRADTLFGVSFLALSPENQITKKLVAKAVNKSELEKYIKEASKKTEIERTSTEKEKTGVQVKGFFVKNPANAEKIPVFIADYVLTDYGTGAIMGVPAHDKRDAGFAKKFGLKITPVITENGEEPKKGTIYEGEGVLINSHTFNGLKTEVAREKLTLFAGGKNITNYKLRDWIFSRQRYWGEPIPMIKCQECGWLPVPEKDLPVKLPKIKNYQPTDNGESPLATAHDWIKTKCPNCKGEAQRETDTMPNWAGSSWYFLRYCDPKNNKVFADKKKLDYWMPVNWYNGGMEHTTLHLLYSRFWNRFLYDIGEVKYPEPYQKRTSQGMILAENGVKMSKSKGNVVNPDKIIKEYGADTLRIYQMFMGPFDQSIAWNSNSISGSRRFLEKVWRLTERVIEKKKTRTSPNLKSVINEVCYKVSEDIENMKFNTAISTFMTAINEMDNEDLSLSKKEMGNFLICLAPFAPHITEELWKMLKNKRSIHLEKWPRYKKIKAKKSFELVVQINGKVRSKITAKSGISKSEAEKLALKDNKIKEILENKKIKKIVFIPDRLISFVV